MFVPLKIAAAEVDRLKARIGDLDIPNIARESDDFYDALLKRCTKEDGTLDGSNLQQFTFPFDKPDFDDFSEREKSKHEKKTYSFFMKAA